MKILHNGDLVKARIHVDVHDGWQIGALSDSQKNNCECQMAFRVHLPDSLASNYEIVSLRETGKVTTVFDSDFLELRSYHTEPFDVIATLKARRKVKTLADFRLFAGYQAVNMIRKQCLPPSWYEVSLKKPDIVAN
ncbi:MAG: hypothetical protein Q8922_00390 [Bacteroidota bacterium]|nr:hypothetical protein [Bacteroidota bacterium]MDP4241627.1 hypothetical protein [Bacteroidota bacterium]MDP4286371.1 hypothetical protein [Bacteroidota bacterium]